MTADAIKRELSRYYLYDRQFMLATTEQVLSYGTADLFVMSKDYMAIEIEIKVSRSDLMLELNCIQSILEQRANPLTYQRKGNKISKHGKHSTYLRPHPNVVHDLPNRFYFAVPDNLKNLVLDYIKGTPYGLLAISGDKVLYTKVIKSGKPLHDKVVAQYVIKNTVRRVCGENVMLRYALHGKRTEYNNLREIYKKLTAQTK